MRQRNWNGWREQSDLHAQYLMGLLYRDGLLLIPDSQSAKYWLTQAAKQGCRMHSTLWTNCFL